MRLKNILQVSLLKFIDSVLRFVKTLPPISLPPKISTPVVKVRILGVRFEIGKLNKGEDSSGRN